jgi:hypothetical protein
VHGRGIGAVIELPYWQQGRRSDDASNMLAAAGLSVKSYSVRRIRAQAVLGDIKAVTIVSQQWQTR